MQPVESIYIFTIQSCFEIFFKFKVFSLFFIIFTVFFLSFLCKNTLPEIHANLNGEALRFMEILSEPRRCRTLRKFTWKTQRTDV